MLIEQTTEEGIEHQVLGAILLDESALLVAQEVGISPEDFRSGQAREIYGAMQRLAERSEPIDTLTLARELRETVPVHVLAELIQAVPSAAHIRRHSQLLREQRTRRDLLALSHRLQRWLEEQRPVVEIVADVDRDVLAAQGQVATQALVPLKALLPGVVQHLDACSRRVQSIDGITTGFRELDALTAGWHAGDLILLAARPSMGKTSLALQCAVTAAQETGRPVAVFSLEMSAEQLALRLVCGESKVNAHTLRTGARDQWVRLASATGALENTAVWINDTPTITLAQMRAQAKRFASQHGLGLLIVDYLQLMPVQGENRQQGVADLSRGLKVLAKELRVPVVALSQLNRAVEGRPDKRPIMSDLRDSGSLEQDADLVLFLYREEVYTPETDDRGIAEVLIRKHRNGPIGDIRLTFDGAHTRFGDA